MSEPDSVTLDSLLDPLDQPIYGVPAFCKVLKRPARTVYGWLEKGDLKGVKKIKGTWASTPRRLLANVTDL
jgi:hypothetical protein